MLDTKTATAPNTITPVQIDVVSDVVCPWCFIGKARLEKALALKPNIPVEVRYHPYFLNPWVPREGMSRDEYLTTKFGSPDRYTSIAGRVAAAAAVGMDANTTREKLASDADVAQIESAANSAKDAGIDGVPTFILAGVAAITGAQSPEVIANAIEQIATNRDKFMAEQKAAAR